MRSPTLLCALLAVSLASTATASVFLPKQMQVKTAPRSFAVAKNSMSNKMNRRLMTGSRSSGSKTAMAIPGYGIAEQVFVGGFGTFLSIYNLVITARILLSWVPQAQGIAILQPVFMITDPYLNLFRGIIPPIFGLDLSPLAAFFLLNVMTNATAAVGAEIPAGQQQNYQNKSVFGATTTGRRNNVFKRMMQQRQCNKMQTSMNL